MIRQRTVTFSTVPEVRTVEDLFAIATAMEREAARRYGELAARMERQGNASLVDLFRRLEREECGHGDGLGDWAERRGIVPSESLAFQWDMPELTSDDDFAEAGGDYLATPWRVLAMAVRNEERAFAFYANVAAKAADDDVRTYAEAMAREELNHVVLLRLERRRAWRTEQADGGADRRSTAVPVDLAALRQYLHVSAGEASARWRQLGEMAAAAGDDETAALFARLGGTEDPNRPSSPTTAVSGPSQTVRDALRDEARQAEKAYDALMAAAEQAADEDVVDWLHKAAEAALFRLALLRDRLAAVS